MSSATSLSVLGKRRLDEGTVVSDGTKRLCLGSDDGDLYALEDGTVVQVSPDAESLLKFMIGVKAWRLWVLQKNIQLEHQPGSIKSKAVLPYKGTKLLKTDLLQCRADELAYSLCMFVKEARKPNGEEYAADTMFYMCLGKFLICCYH